MTTSSQYVVHARDRWNRTVRLDDWYWKLHIYYGHPEFRDCWPSPERCPFCHDRCNSNFYCLEQSIVDPWVVCRDKDHADRDNFYRPLILPPPFTDFWLKVVVRFDQTLGDVVTCYPTNKVHPDDTVRWQR
jgi:hypothetical protein